MAVDYRPQLNRTGMELFDTHFHFYGESTPLEFMEKIRDDLALALERLPDLPQEKITLRLLAAGADYLESVRAMEFAGVIPEVCFACGVHPHQAQEFLADRRDFSLFHGNRKLLAIGEIGLDYFYELAPRREQQQVFEEFLALALEWDLPAMLHLRDQNGRREAYADALTRLEPFVKAGGRFVIHCCTAAEEDLERFLALGAMIGVTGMATFRGAADVREMLRKVPDDRLLLETDSPYLAPIPFRGRENSPGMLLLVAARMAEERGMSLAQMAELSSENGRKFYHIDG